MKKYKCIADLTRKLSDAADKIISCANSYYNEDYLGPYRVLTGDLTDEHGFDEQYVPLLVEMIGECTGAYEIEIIDDEIIIHHKWLLAQFLFPDRMAELLNNALTYISGMVSNSDLYSTFKNSVGMCNEEMIAAGYIFDEPDEDENLGITME